MNTTSLLENEILQTDNVDSFISDNEDRFVSVTFSDFLSEMLQKYGTTKAEIFKRADMTGDNYGYEMFNKDNKKKFSRDKVIRLALGFPLSIDETQKALKLSGSNPLYARNKRDSIIMIGIHKGMNVEQVSDALVQHGENALTGNAK